MSLNQRKIRPDAVLWQLPEERQQEVFARLKKDSYAEVRKWLAEDGIKVGTTALGEFYQRCFSLEWQRKADVSREEMQRRILESGPGYTMEQATEVADAAFIAVSGVMGDMEGYIPLRKIIASERKTALEARKVRMLEATAAKAEALEASLKEKKGKGGLSAETLELIEAALGMLK